MGANWKCLEQALGNGAPKDRQNALELVKDEIIGSNRQKGALICHGLVPAVLDIGFGKSDSINDKINALIILGSLAKGSQEQVQILVKTYNIIPALIKEVVVKNNNEKCIEICLNMMQSINEHQYTAVKNFFPDTSSLNYFISLASPESSLKTQICIAKVLLDFCHTYDDQIQLLQAGAIQVLARMICVENECLQTAALRCLANMCYLNRPVTDNACVTSYQGKSFPDILSLLLSRLFTPEIQLTATKCLTYIYRSGTLLSTDYRILHKTLPTLARLCSENYQTSIRAPAAETLGYLIEIDPELQRLAAISSHLLKSLAQLLQNKDPSVKQAALKCFASLGASDETIRKRIIDISDLINSIVVGLGESDAQVKLASLKCLHSLSRSVQLLRTTFQDQSVWKPLLHIIQSCQSSADTVILTSASSIICNLLLEFSPSKEHLLNAGIIEKLCQFTKHAEPAIRLNGVWALMNMSFQTNQSVRKDIINSLGPKKILDLLCDPNVTIVMKTLGLLRNLLSKSQNIDYIMNLHSVHILESMNMILDSNHSSQVKEQVLCIVGYIAAKAQNGEYIINNEKIMNRLREYMLHTDQKLQASALFAIHNIVHRSDYWSKEKYSQLSELEIINNVIELNKRIIRSKALDDQYISRMLKEIVMQCKNLYPENLK